MSFICIAKVLSVFNIAKPLDAGGIPIEPIVGHDDGTVRYVFGQSRLLLSYKVEQGLLISL